MGEETGLVFALAILLGYVYAFVGGFTDAANAIATSVGSRVLSPRAAVFLAGAFNLLGGLTGTAVALTIGKGLVDPSALSLTTVVAALVGAMTWSLLTYRLGIPVSETHGLIGGIVGAGIATAGVGVIQWQGLTKTLIAIVASPTLGFVGGLTIIVAIYWIVYKKPRGHVMPVFRHLQRASAAFMAFSHGRNDAQKPMGVLAMAIALHYGAKDVTVPLWIGLSCASLAALGTAYGGWRIIDPVQGFAAETAGSAVILGASELGIPISTTHAITSSILGVGSVRRLSAVRWGVTRRIFISWVLTVPATIFFGAAALWVLRGVLPLLK